MMPMINGSLSNKGFDVDGLLVIVSIQYSFQSILQRGSLVSGYYSFFSHSILLPILA
jgi:hypothetical protein